MSRYLKKPPYQRLDNKNFSEENFDKYVGKYFIRDVYLYTTGRKMVRDITVGIIDEVVTLNNGRKIIRAKIIINTGDGGKFFYSSGKNFRTIHSFEAILWIFICKFLMYTSKKST